MLRVGLSDSPTIISSFVVMGLCPIWVLNHGMKLPAWGRKRFMYNAFAYDLSTGYELKPPKQSNPGVISIACINLLYSLLVCMSLYELHFNINKMLAFETDWIHRPKCNYVYDFTNKYIQIQWYVISGLIRISLGYIKNTYLKHKLHGNICFIDFHLFAELLNVAE